MNAKQRADWLAARTTYIGASEVAAICGLHPYSTPRHVFLVKKGLETIEENLPIKVGNWLEDLVAQEFAAYQGIRIQSLRRARLFRHPQFEMFGCNPDRLWNSPEGRSVVQLKTCSEYAAGDFGKNGTDEVKDEHLVQVLWEMWVSGRPFGHLGVLIGNREFKAFRFDWNDTTRAILKRAAEECHSWWHDHYLKDVPPPVSGKDIDTDALKRAYHEQGPGLLRASDQAEEALEGLLELQAEADKLEEEINRRKNVLRENIGNNEGLMGAELIATWRADKNGKRTLRIKDRPFVREQVPA